MIFWGFICGYRILGCIGVVIIFGLGLGCFGFGHGYFDPEATLSTAYAFAACGGWHGKYGSAAQVGANHSDDFIVHRYNSG